MSDSGIPVSSMSNVTYFRVKDDSEPCVVLRGIVSWLPSKYTVKILKESSAYEGEVSLDAVSEHCQSLNLSVEEYINECKLAFKSNSESCNYSFSVDNKCLSVRKRYEAQSGSSFRVILGTVPLKMIDFASTVIEILDSTLNCCNTNNQEIEASSRQIESLRSDNKKMVTRLEEMVNDKLLFERVLYQKFVNLLNSKKEFNNARRISVPGNDVDFDELQSSPRSSNVEDETIFNADTDCDEISEEVTKSLDNDVNFSVKSSNSFEGSDSTVVAGNSNSQSTSSVQNILNSLAFLDPSVSFLNK